MITAILEKPFSITSVSIQLLGHTRACCGYHSSHSEGGRQLSSKNLSQSKSTRVLQVWAKVFEWLPVAISIKNCILFGYQAYKRKQKLLVD